MHLATLLFNLLFIYSCNDVSNDTSIMEPTDPVEKGKVVILEDAFDMPGLNRKRTVRIYLPPSYESKEKSYPVIYMHDGQNLFDVATSYAGEWEVDETLDNLALEKDFEMIVIGIDNGQELRMNELTPWYHPRASNPEGEQYMSFIVDVVRPYINDNYRTLQDKESTVLMGSSMGGLISHYGVFKYPEVFGKAGIFSPSYWINTTGVQEFSSENMVPKETRIYMSAGENEGMMAPSMVSMFNYLLSLQHEPDNITSFVVPNAEHNEAQWKGEFGKAIKWLFKLD